MENILPIRLIFSKWYGMLGINPEDLTDLIDISIV